MAKSVSLPKQHLSLNYHILKLMTHSIYSMPHDSIYAPDVLKKTKEWLGVSPFTKQTLSSGLNSLAKGKFIEKTKKDGKTVYSITDKGREAYASYVDIVTIWEIIKEPSKPLQLRTVSGIFLKSKKHPSTYIPECAFFDWPLTFKPTKHTFKGNDEIRYFDAFEKVTPIS